MIVIFVGLMMFAGCPRMANSPLVPDMKTMEQFNSVVNENEQVAVLFYFSACPGCKIVSPFFNDLAEEYKDKAAFCRVNIHKNKAVGKKYKVRVVPRFMFFKNGENISGLVGINDTDEMPDLFRKYVQ